jgi:hypothetical protein
MFKTEYIEQKITRNPKAHNTTNIIRIIVIHSI